MKKGRLDKAGELLLTVAPQQNTPSLGNSTPRIPHPTEPVSCRRILGEEEGVSQGDRGDRAGRENKDRQIRRVVGISVFVGISKPQVQFSLQLSSKSHTKGRDERDSEEEKGM